MPRKTKVYFIRTHAPDGVHVDQPDHIVQVTAAVTATTQAHAAERFGTTVHALRTWGGDYAQDQAGLVPDAARARPGTVVYFPLDPRPGDTPVYGDTQLGWRVQKAQEAASEFISPDAAPEAVQDIMERVAVATTPVTIGTDWHQSMVQRARQAREEAGLDPDAVPGQPVDNQLGDTSTDEELAEALETIQVAPMFVDADGDQVPGPDQTWCEVPGGHQRCNGYTVAMEDPESCLCSCHSQEAVYGDHEHQRHRPYTVVLGWDAEFTMWSPCALLEGHHVPVPDLAFNGMCVDLLVPEGRDLSDAAWEVANAQEPPG